MCGCVCACLFMCEICFFYVCLLLPARHTGCPQIMRCRKLRTPSSCPAAHCHPYCVHKGWSIRAFQIICTIRIQPNHLPNCKTSWALLPQDIPHTVCHTITCAPPASNPLARTTRGIASGTCTLWRTAAVHECTRTHGALHAPLQKKLSGARQAGERVNAALQMGTERSTRSVAQDARALLNQAGDAQAVGAVGLG